MTHTIIDKGFFVYLHGFCAIDTWLGNNVFEESTSVHILTNADNTDLAKLFENIRYPGIDLADAALDMDDKTWYFCCVDSTNDIKPSFALLDFYYDFKTKTYIDPRGIIPLLEKIKRIVTNYPVIKNSEEVITPLQVLIDGFYDVRALTDAALIFSKYFTYDCGAEKYIKKIAELYKIQSGSAMSQEEQRIFLSELITSPNPGLGLELLKLGGFLENFWQELFILERADHSKDFHPEGNAWIHTMETLRHRKPGGTGCYDLKLSLGLLMHDSGKPLAPSTGSKRYDGHAELGEMQARKFLERLGFDSSMTVDVCWLVRNHMLPAALPRLPLFRTEQIMTSPLFPMLMELYRCDESSSFKGLDGYYESSAVYQQFLKNKSNPYRSATGKKLNKKQKSKKS